MKTYENTESWQRYQALIQRVFDVHLDHVPHESYRDILGHQVHIDTWLPSHVTPQQGTLILVHGGGGNGRLLAPFADFAAQLGWRSLAPDLPGYGLTHPAPDPDSTHDTWAYDTWPELIAALADQEAQHDAGPVVLMGLSVGGLTSVYAAQQSAAVKGVIATTLLDMGNAHIFSQSARWPWLGQLSLLGFRLMPWLIDRIKVPLWLAAPLHKMSPHTDVQKYFAQDAFLGQLWVSLRFFRTLNRRKLNQLTLGCPLLVLHPGADDWTPLALSKQAFDQISTEKSFIALTNGGHLPLEQPAFHELKQHMHQFLDHLAFMER